MASSGKDTTIDDATAEDSTVTFFTLTQVDAWVFGGDPEQEQRVQVTPVLTPREVQRVARGNGIAFLHYGDAADLARRANERAAKDGKLAGSWSAKTIGSRQIYIPLREAVA